MEKLKAKLKKQGGFTLVEMLIVVAIIAILIAVSIPLFNSTLEKTRHGVDAANLRDVISMATAEYLSDLNPEKTFGTTGKTFDYKVDEATHQAELVPYNGTKNQGEIPKCTCTENAATAVGGLQVTISVGTDGKPGIKTSWTIEEGKTTKTDSYEPVAPSTGGST